MSGFIMLLLADLLREAQSSASTASALRCLIDAYVTCKNHRGLCPSNAGGFVARRMAAWCALHGVLMTLHWH